MHHFSLPSSRDKCTRSPYWMRLLLLALPLMCNLDAVSQKDSLKSTGSFSPERFVPVAGINAKGDSFTIRWGSNNKTLTDSPRVVGIGSS
ncbi:MAG: hypothetical protein EOO01_06540, partial [Chitinophagaceae bacterium]